jgi:hypothetical protein
VIWIDGRELPKKIPAPRYYGYSVGKWVDDTTLLVDTIGIEGEPKMWLDEAGRPASDAMHVEERFHRVDRNNLEVTVTIDHPKMCLVQPKISKTPGIQADFGIRHRQVARRERVRKSIHA